MTLQSLKEKIPTPQNPTVFNISWKSTPWQLHQQTVLDKEGDESPLKLKLGTSARIAKQIVQNNSKRGKSETENKIV